MIPCEKLNEVTGNHIAYFYMYVHRVWTLYMHIKSSLVPRPPLFLFFWFVFNNSNNLDHPLFEHLPFPGKKITNL